MNQNRMTRFSVFIRRYVDGHCFVGFQISIYWIKNDLYWMIADRVRFHLKNISVWKWCNLFNMFIDKSFQWKMHFLLLIYHTYRPSSSSSSSFSLSSSSYFVVFVWWTCPVPIGRPCVWLLSKWFINFHSNYCCPMRHFIQSKIRLKNSL